MRKVFTENLPRWTNRGLEGKIKWSETIGYKVRFIYDDIEGEVEIVDYNIKEHKIILKYLAKEKYPINTNSFINCKLGVMLGLTNEFKIEIGDTFKDNKRDITIIDRDYREKTDKKGKIYNIKYYQYRCNKCGFCDDRSWLIESDLLKGNGCKCCCTAPKVIVDGINDIPTTAPFMVKFFQGGYDEAKQYTKGSTKKIYPICPDCGRVKNKEIIISSIYKTHSIGCSCSDGYSYPNKITFNMLEQLNINFIPEYSPDWIKLRKYDFYFEKDNIKYIVELDGMFHYIDNTRNGQTKEESRMIDDYKDDMADRHGIEMIRIDCRKSEVDFIKNNIKDSILNKLFDLSKIDWI